jgi:hypothetical protein
MVMMHGKQSTEIAKLKFEQPSKPCVKAIVVISYEKTCEARQAPIVL